MPIVSLPDVFIDPSATSPTWTAHRLEGRTVRALVTELFARFPRLRLRYPATAEQGEIKWFGLWRDEDDYDLRGEPDTALGEDDVLHFVNLIGC